MNTQQDTRDGAVPLGSPERCELTELIKTQCGHCRGPKRPRFVEPLFDPPAIDEYHEEEIISSFPARYSGWCARCCGKIQPGDWVSRTTGNSYLCSECAP